MEQNFYCCSFCYKNVDEGELEKEEVDQVLLRFIKLVRRHFGGKETGGLVNLESCPDCLLVVTSFCDLYHQLKCIELEVGWRLSRLKNVMTGADKVEFRKENFRRSWRKRGGNEREMVEMFRKEFIEKCNSPVSTSFPKVVLTRRRKAVNHNVLHQFLDNPQSILPFLGGGPSPGKGMVLDLVLVQSGDNCRSETTPQPPPPPSYPPEDDDNYEEMQLEEPPSEDESELRISNVRNGVKEIAKQPEQLQAPPPVTPPTPPTPTLKTQIPARSEMRMMPQPEVIPVKTARLQVEEARVEVDVPAAEISTQLSSSSTPVNVQVVVPPAPTETFQEVLLTSSAVVLSTRSLRPRKQQLNSQTNEEEGASGSEKEFEDTPDDDFHADEHMSEVDSEGEAEQSPTKKPKLLLPPTPSLFVSSGKARKCQHCPNCPLSFDSEEELAAHQKLHGSFPCSHPSCDFTTSYAPKLAVHEQTHSTPTKNDPTSSIPNSKKRGKGCMAVKCPRCPTLTFGKINSYIYHFLVVHLNLTSINEINQCFICKLSFFNILHSNGMKLRRKHIADCHNIKGMDEASVVRCDKCPAYFRRHMQLFTHNKKMHGGDALQCKDCGTKLTNSYDLRRHRIDVHKLNPADFNFICDIPACSERFETERDLECHKSARHNKSFKEDSDTMMCTECGKTFAGPLGLKGHMRIHEEGFLQKVEETKKKSEVVCDQCGKRFRDKGNLGDHKLFVHLGPDHWKFECEVCGKKCFNKNKLDEHARVHLKDKKFQFICDICGASYAHAHNLRLHKKNKHGSKATKTKDYKKEEIDDDSDC